MIFDAKTWQCTTCNGIGTLCLQEINITVLSQVTHIDKYVTTGHFEHGNYGNYSYICSGCGIKVADTDEELIGLYGPVGNSS